MLFRSFKNTELHIKIDLEHFDTEILRALFLNNVFPPYISAEAHSVDPFAIMLALGKYKSFQIVEGFKLEL